MMKKKLSVLISVLMMLVTIFALPASAANVSTGNEQYIVFRDDNPKQRIDSKGYFDFSVKGSLISASNFNISSNSVTIVITTYANDGHSFDVTLCQDYESVIGSVTKTFSATGKAQSKTFSGLDKNKKYWLVINNRDRTLVEGYGHISNSVG